LIVVMMSLLRIAAVAVFASVVIAPGWGQAQSPGRLTGRPSPPNSRDGAVAGACEIGVIAGVGDLFQVRRIGLLTNNTSTSVAIEPWGLDDLAFERARAAGGPGTVRFPYSKDRFPAPPQRTLFYDENAERVEMLRVITGGRTCRRVVLIGRSISQVNGLGETVRGVGIVNWNAVFAEHTYVYTLGFIWIYDGADFTLLCRGSALSDREPLLGRPFGAGAILGPYRELDNATFPTNATDAVNNPLLRETARSMLKSSLDRTLPKMLRACKSKSST